MTTTDPFTIKLSDIPLTREYRYNFVTAAGARYRAEHDPGSRPAGEKFLVKVLAPAFAGALASGRDLALVFDQPYKVRSEFLGASIGGLAQKFGTKQVQDHLRVHATVDHIDVIDRISSGLVGSRPRDVIDPGHNPYLRVPGGGTDATNDFCGITFVWMG